MIVSRQQILEARNRKCSWTEAELAAAIEARFPGGGDLELADLIAAWVADRALPAATLRDCAWIAGKLAGQRPRTVTALFHPATELERIAVTLSTPPP